MYYFRDDMQKILAYCEKINDQKNRTKFIHLISWVQNEFNLVPSFEWYTPTFADNNIIVGFQAEIDGIVVAIDSEINDNLYDEIKMCKYKCEQKSFIIKWNQKIDFGLLTKIINCEKEANIPSKSLAKLLPLKFDFSHDAYLFPPGLANTHLVYDKKLNAYVDSGREGDITISAQKNN